MIRAIIVDDEERARDVLANLLAEYCPEVQIIASCATVPDAVIKINQLEPDVVFCDIEMPDYNGFELLSFFKKVEFEIIFVTAYSEYALRAFEVSAVDYLLKPVEIEKLEAAVAKLSSNLKGSSMQNRLDTLKQNLRTDEIQKIAFPHKEGLTFIDVNDIMLVEADGSYANIWMNDGKRILVSKKLRFFEEALADKKVFFRVHRSNLININYITEYIRSDNSILLEKGKAVSISRDRKADFEEFIKLIRV